MNVHECFSRVFQMWRLHAYIWKQGCTCLHMWRLTIGTGSKQRSSLSGNSLLIEDKKDGYSGLPVTIPSPGRNADNSPYQFVKSNPNAKSGSSCTSVIFTRNVICKSSNSLYRPKTKLKYISQDCLKSNSRIRSQIHLPAIV